MRDLHEPGSFVSFGSWDSVEQLRGWTNAPEFRGCIARVLHCVEEFKSTELALVARAPAAATRAVVIAGNA